MQRHSITVGVRMKVPDHGLTWSILLEDHASAVAETHLQHRSFVRSEGAAVSRRAGALGGDKATADELSRTKGPPSTGRVSGKEFSMHEPWLEHTVNFGVSQRQWTARVPSELTFALSVVGSLPSNSSCQQRCVSRNQDITRRLLVAPCAHGPLPTDP